MTYNSIILAAGKGTRMRSPKPKVIHEVFDTPMINLIIEELEKANITNNNLIVGYKGDEIQKVVNEQFDVSYFNQEEQLGTAHAVMQAEPGLLDVDGVTIITCGDTPLVTAEIFEDLIKFHEENNNDLTVLSAHLDNSTNYGRIVRDNGTVTSIVEEADADEETKQIKEINTGIFCIDNKLLFKYIKDISNDNNQEEYYLTDIVKVFKDNNLKIDAHMIYDEQAIMGINDLVALSRATEVYKQRINQKHLLNGVNIIDPNNTYIGKNVEIGVGTVIHPNNTITGNTKIGENNVLKPGNVIEDTIMGDNNQIGPTSYFRGNNVIGSNVRIGCFVELKATEFNDNSKTAHLTYLGDASIGENVNIGCGVITANYDGENKFKTIIKDNAFIGSNVNIVAPCTVGEDSFIAAGTTITKEIPENKFVIGRSKQEIKDKK